MEKPCKRIRYKKKRNGKAVVKSTKTLMPLPTTSDEKVAEESKPLFFLGEGEFPEDDAISFLPPRNTVDDLRDWVKRQRFIPQDLTDEFLTVFLSGSGFDLDVATEKLHRYFYSRQEPSPLFRNRDPLNPENVKLLEKLYVVPMPDTTENGAKIIIMGTTEQAVVYNPWDHAKVLAMVLDLLIWEKDFGFGEFIIVFDGRGFACPQLLEKKMYDRTSITSLLLDTIPGTLRSFYLLYPPAHAKNVAESRDGLWITVVRNKQEMIGHLPADILPLEYGGNLGHLQDLLVQWHEHLAQSRDFFIHFESKMANDRRRRVCHEKEVEEGGRNWVHRMKLEADEWEYKIGYYERMKKVTAKERPGFGKDRIAKLKSKKKESAAFADPLKKCKRMVKAETEANLTFEPTYLYHGYASEMRKAKLEADRTVTSNPSNFPECPRI